METIFQLWQGNSKPLQLLTLQGQKAIKHLWFLFASWLINPFVTIPTAYTKTDVVTKTDGPVDSYILFWSTNSTDQVTGYNCEQQKRVLGWMKMGDPLASSEVQRGAYQRCCGETVLNTWKLTGICCLRPYNYSFSSWIKREKINAPLKSFSSTMLFDLSDRT